MNVLIGKITHYYDKIAVAVISVSNGKLKTGDIIKISGHDKEFTQTVTSLEMDYKQVGEVRAGESAGMKVDQPVKAGDVCYLLPH